MKPGRTIIILFLATALALINVFPALAASPSVTNVTSTAANTSYNAGKTISIQVVFDQAVTVNISGGSLTLALNSGGIASYSSGSGTTTLNFSYIVGAGENSSDLDYTGTDALVLTNGTIQNAGLEDADLTLPPPSAQHSLGYNKDIIIDTTPPTVTDVSSGMSDGSYKAGQVIDIEVTFSEVVVKTGTPTLALNSGGTASYSSGTQSNVLTFTYTVASGNTSADLDYSSTSALTGTIKDAAGNSATLTLPATGSPTSLGGHKSIVIDTTSPTINIGTPSATFTKSGPVSFTVSYSDINFNTSTLSTSDITLNVTGTAAGTVAVTGSGATRTVTISGITGDGTLGISIAAGTASDMAGNLAAASGNSTTFIVDNTPPTISVSAPNQAITRTGPVTYTVTYSDLNFNTSTLALANITLNKTGTANGTVGLSGSGTSHTVTVSSISGDGTLGISIAAGTASDKAGNTAPASGASTTFIVDNTAPTVTINQAVTQLDPTNATPINFTVVFSEAVTNFATGDVTLDGTAGATAATVTSTGSTTYNVAVSGMTTSGTVTASIAAGVASDAAGNTNTASTSADNSVTYDSKALTVTINQAAAQLDPTNASPINFTVVFNKAVTDFATGDVTLTGTAGATTATVTSTNSTTYNVAASGMTGNGTIIANILAGVAHDAAGNSNTASTSTDNTVTYDTIAPVISAVSPVSGAHINSISSSSAVSYTLSENIASGSISMIWTGGTADASHTCTLKGTALNSGTHNALDLSDTTNACTQAQSLISGAVYTFSFDATDAAGNVAATVSSTNVTFETTGPVFSAVTPLSDSSINSITVNSDVNYSLSKPIASGSITMTWTGGTADVSHTCTLKGKALNSGAHNKLDLSNTTNSCTTAQSLVDGAIYTFTFRGTDSAGNVATPVISTNVTFDVTAPVFSLVAPVTNAFINSITSNSAVSYTLSEVIASGSITMTQTGGTNDPNSPHICTLTGLALQDGAHNNLDLSDTINSCTQAQALVDESVYTFTFNAIDPAGNIAATITRANVTFENTAPVFSAVTPATNSYIRAITNDNTNKILSAVGYTLSKTIATGSITMTRTGGQTDTGSPHVCTLKGTALSIGAHANLDLSDTTNSCTVAQSLVDGAIYSFTFRGSDAAGNAALTVTNTGVTFDKTAPTISWSIPPCSPTGCANIPKVVDQSYQLEVTASDNVGINMVVFKRYDYNAGTRYEIGRVYNPPYTINFDTSQLLPSYNEIDAIALDNANNSTWIYLFLDHLPVLTVVKASNGNGSVTSSPTGIDCGLTCSAGFSDNAVVTLTAIPIAPSRFEGWGGIVCAPGDPGCSCSGTGTCTVTMDQAKTVIAYFSKPVKIFLPLIHR